MQNAPGVTFVMKEMVKHLFHLVLINALSLFVVRKRTKSGAEYNIKLIGQPTHYFKFSAAVIGMLFDVIAILIVIAFDVNRDIMTVIAALFICIGPGRRHGAARVRQAHSAGSRTPVSRRPRRAAPPRERSSRRRGTSTARRRPTARDRRRRSSTWRRRG